MPNTYAKLGQSAGDILSALSTGDPAMSAKGYGAGMEAGSQSVLRNAQARKSLADTQKIMFELDQARQAQNIGGEDIAEAMGIPREITSLVRGGYQTQHPLPAGEMGPAAPPSVDTPIPPYQADMVNRAYTAKILQQLGGGNAQSLAAAMGSLREQNLGDRMMAGDYKPTTVAPVQAAIAGRDPTFASSSSAGGKATAKVQEMQFLMSPQGGKLDPEAAARQVFGDDGARMWVQAYTALVGKYYEPEEAAQKATEAVQLVQQQQGGNAPAVPGNVVKVYK